MIWIVLTLMTGAATLAVLLPLSRRAASAANDSDIAFYRQQLDEIERDAGRGLLGPAEAEAARAEAGRRLLRAGERARVVDSVGEPALRRRRAMSAVILSTVPLVAVTAYSLAGSPGLPAQPLHARLRTDPGAMDVAQALARIEAHLARNPEDGRGFEVIAPVYLRLGRADDAAKAYQAALRLLGESPARLGAYGEALMATGGGVVTAEARAAFERVLALDAADPKARYYLAVAAEQDGDAAAARRLYEALVASSPAEAPWLPAVRQRLAGLDGGQGPAQGTSQGPSQPPSQGSSAALAALPAGERAAAIRGMVEGLASRLEAGGGSPEEWGRLVRSYAVLGERDKAAAALGRARRSLGAEAGGGLDRLAGELGLAPPQGAPQGTEPGANP